MTKRTTPLLLAAFLVAACGGSTEPSIDMDGKAEVAKGDAKDAKGEVCTPDCADKKCGSDGCQGNCGTCGDGLECGDDGKCAAVTCKSSKDCPGALVCAQDLGECVACVGDEDCDEGLTCGADHECHETYECTSDIDCKEHDMVCDKTAGQCVECLTANECAEEEYCKDNYCLPVECLPGEAYCDENVVVACLEDGSGWTTAETCGEGQYCEDAACHDYVCTPDAIWCDGEVYKVCSEDGKSVKFEEDCAAKGQHCFNGACIDTVCVPMEKFCVDDFSYGLCAADGMEFTPYDCPAEHFCAGGECYPQVCPPGTVFCQDNVAATCDQKGSSLVNQVNCAATGKVCVDGLCLDLACAPGTDFCVDNDTVGLCADDGLTFESTDCPAQHSCEDGVCKSWACTPGEPMCDETVATICDTLGLGPAAGGTDCEPLGKFCSGGDCVDCEPQCDGKACGDDGCGGDCGTCPPNVLCQDGQCSGCDDGNDVDWDGCTNGEITEFQVNTYTSGSQNLPAVGTSPDGRFLVVWESENQDGFGHGIYAQFFDEAGKFDGLEFQVNSVVAGNQRDPDVAASSQGGYLVAWNSWTPDADHAEIYGQMVSAEGQTLGGSTVVNTGVDCDYKQVSAAADPNGGYVVAWHRTGGGDKSVLAQRLDEFGGKIGTAIDLSVWGAQEPAVDVQSNGAFVAAWQSNEDIYGGIWASDGQPELQAFKFNTDTLNKQAVPAVAVLSDDRFVVVWHGDLQVGSGIEVSGRLFSSDGTPEGDEFKVSTQTQWPVHLRPAVSSLTDGGFVIVWEYDAVHTFLGQIYDTNGNKVGAEITVSKFNQLDNGNCDVSFLPGGGFLAVWSTDGQDLSGHGAYAQRFDADGNKLYH